MIKPYPSQMPSVGINTNRTKDAIAQLAEENPVAALVIWGNVSGLKHYLRSLQPEEAKKDVNTPYGEDEITPLYLAVLKERDCLIRALMQFGADPDQPCRGTTPRAIAEQNPLVRGIFSEKARPSNQEGATQQLSAEG